MDRAAEGSLRKDDAKISDKAPLSHEIRGREIKKAQHSQHTLLSRTNESDAFSWPAFKLKSGI